MFQKIKKILLWLFSLTVLVFLYALYQVSFNEEVIREMKKDEQKKESIIKAKHQKQEKEEFLLIKKEKEALFKQSEELKKKKLLEEKKEKEKSVKREVYLKSVISEKKILAGFWYSETQLWLTMINNGTTRNGFAEYLCVSSRDYNLTNTFSILLYDAKLFMYDRYVVLGESRCVSH